MTDQRRQQPRQSFGMAALVTGLIAALCCGGALPGPAAAPQQGQKGPDDAKEFLYKAQKNGNWESSPTPTAKGGWELEGGQWGGQTAIATYALLASGESPQDARIKAAIDWLKKADIKGIYALGMRAQVWTFLE